MNKTLNWRRLDNPTHEDAVVSNDSRGGTLIRSTIAGAYEGHPVDLDYTLQLRPDWSWESFDMVNRCGPSFNLQRGTDAPFNIPLLDFFLTPVTNTLAIRRLALGIGKQKDIKTVYFLPETFEPRIEEQTYERLQERQYRFTSDGGAFSAVIAVDDEGWVIEYEGLFHRTPR